MSNEVVLQLDPTPTNSRNSEGSFVTLKDGRILFAYTKYNADHEDHGSAIVCGRYSSDNGKTWTTEDRTIIGNEGQLNVMSVSFLRLADGRIALFNLRKDNGPYGITCVPYVRFSTDEAKTFSEPIRITNDGYFVLNNDRVIQTRTGRLIAPVALHRARGGWTPGKNSYPDLSWSSAATIIFYLSDDGGAHWFESINSLFPYTPDNSGLQEPGVVELNDGTLYGYARAGLFGLKGVKGRQWDFVSSDNGFSLGEPKPSQFISPCSPLSIKRIPSTGHLLAVWNDHSGRVPLPAPLPASWGRTPLVSAISDDEGKTWKHHKILEDAPDHGFCYTAIHFAGDAVLLAYCAGGATTKLVLDRQRMRRITVADLY
jgi:hypothetical protein